MKLPNSIHTMQLLAKEKTEYALESYFVFFLGIHALFCENKHCFIYPNTQIYFLNFRKWKSNYPPLSYFCTITIFGFVWCSDPVAITNNERKAKFLKYFGHKNKKTHKK